MSRNKRGFWLPKREIKLTIEGLNFTYKPTREVEQFCIDTSEQIKAIFQDKKKSHAQKSSAISKLARKMINAVLGDDAIEKIEAAAGYSLSITDFTAIMEYVASKLRH